MKVRFWGVRGSIASPGLRTARYGGNTACVEIRAADRLIIVDAGTGIHELGTSLTKESAGAPIEGSLFIGHTHWDHVQGFPFFTPLYLPANRFQVYGMHGTTRSFSEAMAGIMQSTYFPVRLKDMTCALSFHELNAPVMIGPVKVSYHFLNHPGITVGFRFEHKGKIVCYLSDHEPYAKLNRAGDFSDKEDAAVGNFAKDSDLLICEAQYTADEYKRKRGWGHSTFEDVLGLALKAGAKRLALFHHDPAHDDDAMDALVDSCVKLAAAHGAAIEVFAAREGQTIEI